MSWDDGNMMDLKIVKLLHDLDLKGTFYIPINWVTKSLPDSEIKKISKNFEIGSHSYSHRRMNFLNDEEVKFEMSESKKILEKLTKKKIVSFAYPFGWHNKKTIAAVKEAGYRFARTTNEGNFLRPKNPFTAAISLGITNSYASPIKILSRMLNYGSFDFFKSLKKIVDNAKKNDIVHIAGHSWEFRNNEDFEKLASMLEYISEKDIKPITNSEILKL